MNNRVPSGNWDAILPAARFHVAPLHAARQHGRYYTELAQARELTRSALGCSPSYQ